MLVAGNGGLGGNVVLNFVEVGHSRKGEFFNHSQCFASVLAGVLCCIAALEVDEGFLSLNHRKTVLAGCILGGFAPRRAAGLGATGTNDKADLLNAYGNVKHDLCTVVTGVHDVAAAFFAIPPSPNVAIFNDTGVRPVEGDLVVALLFGNGVFALGDLPLAGSGGCVGIRCYAIVLVGVGAGDQHSRKHNCNKKEGKNA